jgi:hypothetical protein
VTRKNEKIASISDLLFNSQVIENTRYCKTAYRRCKRNSLNSRWKTRCTRIDHDQFVISLSNILFSYISR